MGPTTLQRGGEQDGVEQQWRRQVTAKDKAESFWLSSFCHDMSLWDISLGGAAHSCFSPLLGLLPAPGLAEPGPQGVDFSLRRVKGCVHLFRKGHGQRNSLCTVTRKPHHQSGFAFRGLQKKIVVCTALLTLLCRGWVMPVYVTQ